MAKKKPSSKSSNENKDTKRPSKFDVSNFAKPKNFKEKGATKRQQGNYEVRKPHRQHFIRVRSGEEFRRELPVLVVELDGQRKEYLISLEIFLQVYEEFENDIHDVQFRLAITRQGTLSLWALRIPQASSPRILLA